MSSDSDEVSHVPFSERPEYADLTPVLQDDGPDPVCPINYLPDYVDTMNYFRALLKKEEKSQRALWVTQEVIDYNPSNYTAFYYRRLILENLGDWEKELDYITKIIPKNLKNYQVWHHRRCIVEKLNNPSNELNFIATMLQKDAKNYHAWSYRQWILKTYNLFENELEYIDSLLNLDIRNNSAWNQRYFIMDNTTDMGLDTRKQEIQYTIQKILMAPNNQSSWNYLRGMMNNMSYSDFPEVEELCKNNLPRFVTCVNLYALLIDIYEQKGDQEHMNLSIEYCDKLIGGIDDIHKKYWIYRKKKIQERLHGN